MEWYWNSFSLSSPNPFPLFLLSPLVPSFRDSSSTGGSETPSSPHIQSPELNLPPVGIVPPPSGHQSHFSSSNHFGSSMNHEGGGGMKKSMSRRPPDGVSSSPSNYTPLQPSGRPGRL